MAGTVVMIVILVLFPILLFVSGLAGAALLGWLLQRDRDQAYEGTEYREIAHANPYDAA